MTRPVVQESPFLKFLSQRSLNWNRNLRILGNSADSFEHLPYIPTTGRNAGLNDSAFPSKRSKLFTGTKDAPKSSSRNVLNFSFLSSGTKKACNTESEMKPRNLTKVDCRGELVARLIKYPAKMRRNNKIKAAACASCRPGWQTAGSGRNNWPTCLSSIYCETVKPKDRTILLPWEDITRQVWEVV